MAPRKKTDRELLDHFVLTNDYLGQFLPQGLVDCAQFVDRGDGVLVDGVIASARVFAC